MQDKLQAFREPIVTATGIRHGFILNFAASWVKSETLMPDWMAYVVGVSVLAGIILLIRVLYRALRFARVNPGLLGMSQVVSEDSARR